LEALKVRGDKRGCVEWLDRNWAGGWKLKNSQQDQNADLMLFHRNLGI
jgi:hypothetical protein